MTIRINLTTVVITILVLTFLYVMGNMAIDFFTGLNDVVEARTVVPSATPQP